jgi:signal transduction histidine kinase
LAAGGHRANVDRDMIYQAVLNLLGNAVKYTPECGTVTVEAFIHPAGESAACGEGGDGAARKAVVRIADTGSGISPRDLPFVFDKFYRPDGNARRAGGSGLGLALARQIIEALHGGRMFVESQMGKGSVFGFELDVCEEVTSH